MFDHGEKTRCGPTKHSALLVWPARRRRARVSVGGRRQAGFSGRTLRQEILGLDRFAVLSVVDRAKAVGLFVDLPASSGAWEMLLAWVVAANLPGQDALRNRDDLVSRVTIAVWNRESEHGAPVARLGVLKGQAIVDGFLDLLHSGVGDVFGHAEEFRVAAGDVAVAHDVAEHVHVLRLGDDGLGVASARGHGVRSAGGRAVSSPKPPGLVRAAYVKCLRGERAGVRRRGRRAVGRGWARAVGPRAHPSIVFTEVLAETCMSASAGAGGSGVLGPGRARAWACRPGVLPAGPYSVAPVSRPATVSTAESIWCSMKGRATTISMGTQRLSSSAFSIHFMILAQYSSPVPSGLKAVIAAWVSPGYFSSLQPAAPNGSFSALIFMSKGIAAISMVLKGMCTSLSFSSS